MENQVPILDADGVVKTESLSTYIEVLDAVTDGQWLMVAPRLTVRLQKDLQFEVQYSRSEESVKVIGTPFYWRGPFVGMRVRPASSADLNRARQISRKLLHQAEAARASDARQDSVDDAVSHTSYAMKDPQAEDSTEFVRSAPVAEPNGEAISAPVGESSAEPEAESTSDSAVQSSAEPAVEVEAEADTVTPEDPIFKQAPEVAALEPTAPGPNADAPATLPEVALPDAEFVPVAPPPSAPTTAPPAPDSSEFTETDYIDLDGASTPLDADGALDPAPIPAPVDSAAAPSIDGAPAPAKADDPAPAVPEAAAPPASAEEPVAAVPEAAAPAASAEEPAAALPKAAAPPASAEEPAAALPEAAAPPASAEEPAAALPKAAAPPASAEEPAAALPETAAPPASAEEPAAALPEAAAPPASADGPAAPQASTAPPPSPAAERKPRSAAGAPDLKAAIPELRGKTLGGFTDEGLLLSFPDKKSGLPLPEDVTLYRVLSVLASYEVSGQLALKQGDEEAILFLRKGTLLGIEPMGSTFDQYFGDFLLEEKAIEQEPLDAAIAHAQAFDKTLPVALYEKRSIGMDVMGRVLRDLKQKIFFDLLKHPDPYSFHFVAKRKFGRKFDPMRVHLAGTLVDFVRAQLAGKYLADLEPLLEPYKFKYAQVRDSDVIPIDVLNLDDKQRHAVKHVFHGPNRLNEAYSLCLLTRHGTARLITLLHHFGLINWLDEAGTVAGQETIEDRLKVIHRHLQAGDHFKRLEVHWGAHPRKIEAALNRFRKKYDPEQPLARHSEEAGQLCTGIMSLVQESHDFLIVKRQRRDYRLEKQGDMRVRRAAEFLVKQADLVRFRGDWDEAFDLLEAAIDMWEHPSFVSKHQQWRAERRG